jgi:protein-L-isoaspartate(D-aspartate) O-methyltransferase
LVRDLAARGIRPGPVLEAMRLVPREAFLPEALRADAYADASLPIGEDQTISQPWIVARMTELLEPDGTGRVLEIGTGSGYQAAILAHVFEQVYTVERSPLLSRRARAAVRSVGIENVHFKIFDGGYGWSEFAPYRAAVVTAAVPQVPAPVLEQVADGGCLVLPLAAGGGVPHVLTRLEKRGAEVVRSEHGPCRFVPLLGKYGWNPATP